MTTETKTTPPKPKAAGRNGWCSWHEAYARGVRLIRIEDAGSGPRQMSAFACRPCREAYDLVPLADRP
ncbi:hypothetical protein OHA71_23955 [Streptomyces sp. NBC_00444]|uniref:hypothetical protein n=1 Tax=Streptomyces sp. NBC_00444 TaxID=2975744 RepID=UPI002E215787